MEECVAYDRIGIFTHFCGTQTKYMVYGIIPAGRIFSRTLL